MSYLIGIAGGSGSGKTTFAHKVISHLPEEKISLVHMDSYYKDIIPKDVYLNDRPNYDHPMAFDWELLTEHLKVLKDGHTVQAPTYDFKTNSRNTETQIINPAKVILFEGIFSLYDLTIRKMLNIKCFLNVDADIRFTRRLHRDVNERGRTVESVISQYYATVRPMYQKFLGPQVQFADFTVGEETDNAARILAARLNELINE